MEVVPMIETIIFYVSLILLLYIFRKNFKVEEKIKVGKYSIPILFLFPIRRIRNFMVNFSGKHMRMGRFLGKSSIIVMFFVMIYGVYSLTSFAFLTMTKTQEVLAMPEAEVVVMLPGIGIPLIAGWAALLIAMLVHELCHAWVGISYGYKLKSTGMGMLLFLPLAYVQFIGEGNWSKKPPKNHNKFVAAGCYANFLAFLLFFGLFYLADFIPNFPYVVLQFFGISAVLNLLLSIVNILPLFGITDGSLIVRSILQKYIKDKELSSNIYKIIIWIMFLIYAIPIVIILWFKGF